MHENIVKISIQSSFSKRSFSNISKRIFFSIFSIISYFDAQAHNWSCNMEAVEILTKKKKQNAQEARGVEDPNPFDYFTKCNFLSLKFETFNYFSPLLKLYCISSLNKTRILDIVNFTSTSKCNCPYCRSVNSPHQQMNFIAPVLSAAGRFRNVYPL